MFKPQLRIPATYMRGGTSKGVFFVLHDLPQAVQQPGKVRDRFLQRVIGSPDPYAKHTDGMGGATSSTSKTVILSKSDVPEHDVNYLYGQIGIEDDLVDWSGNCGNLTAAVGTVAIQQGLVDASRIPQNGICEVRIWQQNTNKTIISRVPITNGEVQETGDFELDGVTFPAAEVVLEFVDPVDADEALFPTGKACETLSVEGVGDFTVTMITAGIPTIFVKAEELGYSGTELQSDINSDDAALAKFEKIRAAGALKMGLIDSLEQAATRQHTPKVAFVAPAKDYTASSGKAVNVSDIDVLVRALSMGKLHHAMMGTAAVAIGVAAAIPGTTVNQAAGGIERADVTFGHPSGTLKVGAVIKQQGENYQVQKATMSRSARTLMEGFIRIPAESID